MGGSLTDERAILRAAVRDTMHAVCADLPLLYQVVADGGSAWRNATRQAFAGWPWSDALADQMFHFFQAKAMLQFTDLATETYTPRVLAARALDAMEVPSPVRPPTADAINDAWTLDVTGSSEAFVREHIGPGEDPTRVFQRVRVGASDV
jgi:hypothetical protein